MVSRMLKFRADMLSVLRNSFANHAEFAQALKEGERQWIGMLLECVCTLQGNGGRGKHLHILASTYLPVATAGFEACLNSRTDKPAELIARYLDSILRRGSKAGAQESSLEEVLDAALALFRYVQVKGKGLSTSVFP